MPSEKETVRSRLQRNWVSSLGVQTWLFTAAREWASEVVYQAADRLAPPSSERSPALKSGSRSGQNGQALSSGAGTVRPPMDGPYPKTTEELKSLITFLKDAILLLDDVKDYETVRAIDDDMYYLWKELERKMQLHRQSEAKFQLREMFRI